MENNMKNFVNAFEGHDISERGTTLYDYWMAPSGEGELAYEWEDKPHRLLYDLISYAVFLEKKISDQK